MDKHASVKQRRNTEGDLFASVNEIMLALAGYLMEYVSILKRTESRPSVAKQKA